MPFADNLHSSARTEPSHQALLSGPAGHRHRTGLGGIRQSANVANSWARPNQFEPDWTCWTNFLNIFQSSTAVSSEMLWGSDIEDVSVPPANEPSSGPGTPIPGRRLPSNCWTVLPLECSRPPSNAHTHTQTPFAICLPNFLSFFCNLLGLPQRQIWQFWWYWSRVWVRF